VEDVFTAGQQLAPIYPRYSAAVTGFRDYWYPVAFSRDLGSKPLARTLCGESIALFRDGGRVYALHDRCPHRGIPLSRGRKEFPGTISCMYHAWTYALDDGQLVAVITDGPDSPICGKATVAVKTYPAEERAGLIWVYLGSEPAPPVEADIPTELLRSDTVLEGTCRLRTGNWRYAMENGVDEGHAKYQHRHALWYFFRENPAWAKAVRTFPSEDGVWLERSRGEVVYSDVYGGPTRQLGRWPPKGPRFWQSRSRGITGMSLRLPCIMRQRQQGWTEYQIYVPWDADHYLGFLLAAKWTSGLDALAFRARYHTYIRWLKHEAFYAEDQLAIDLMSIPPERLYRPDAAITAWRRFCEDNARRPAAAQASPVRAGAPSGAGDADQPDARDG
jgi:phenylpropionate dioxygenase-like ring-hydroxylating dioxygenase large terminal subunit